MLELENQCIYKKKTKQFLEYLNFANITSDECKEIIFFKQVMFFITCKSMDKS